MRIPWNPQLMAPMRFPWCSPQVRWNSFPQRRAGGSFHGTFLGTLERLDLEKYGKMDENGLVSPGGDFEDSDLRSIWRFEFGKVVIFWNMSSWTENRELRIGIPAANYRDSANHGWFHEETVRYEHSYDELGAQMDCFRIHCFSNIFIYSYIIISV